jgi:diguanylate cyclase (GGDEF)-like protein
MDSLTAGIILILLQVCIALVMAGVFFAAPTEKCTRYWALAGSYIALGVLIAILNSRHPRSFVLLSGGGLIMAGLIYQWHGILAFYKKQAPKWSWLICVAFLVSLGLALHLNVPMAERSILFSVFTLLLHILSFRAVWQGQNGPPQTFVQRLVQGAILLLMIGNVLKLWIAGVQICEAIPATRTTFDVVTTYVIPAAGTVLFSIGLLLLYFERTIEENRHLATHDELSKLLNRRAIVAAGERELDLSIRLQRSLTVAFIDIDLFKHFNDEFGHAAGDTVLAEVAAILQKTCRSIDLVGRYGGEEFLVILPGVDLNGAALIGQRLINAVRDYRFLGEHPVTISAGLATLPLDGNCSWAQLIRRADAALYEAKDMGRNRFCV